MYSSLHPSLLLQIELKVCIHVLANFESHDPCQQVCIFILFFCLNCDLPNWFWQGFQTRKSNPFWVNHRKLVHAWRKRRKPSRLQRAISPSPITLLSIMYVFVRRNNWWFLFVFTFFCVHYVTFYWTKNEGSEWDASLCLSTADILPRVEALRLLVVFESELKSLFFIFFILFSLNILSFYDVLAFGILIFLSTLCKYLRYSWSQLEACCFQARETVLTAFLHSFRLNGDK